MHDGEGARREGGEGDTAGRRRGEAGGAAGDGGGADDGRAGPLPGGRARARWRPPRRAVGRRGAGARRGVRHVPDEAPRHAAGARGHGAPRRRGHQGGPALGQGGRRGLALPPTPLQAEDAAPRLRLDEMVDDEAVAADMNVYKHRLSSERSRRPTLETIQEENYMSTN